MQRQRRDDRRIAMPAMPKKLPCRLEAGLEKPAQREDEQDACDQIKGTRRDWGSCRVLFLLLVHREHALRDKEAAEDVHRREVEREEAEQARPDRAAVEFAEFDADREHAPTTITDEIALVTEHPAAYAAPASPARRRK